jgi:hypothetical protein
MEECFFSQEFKMQNIVEAWKLKVRSKRNECPAMKMEHIETISEFLN